MYLSGRSLRLRKQGRKSNPRRIIVLLALILGGLILITLNQRGTVQPLFSPTLPPTRIPESFADEAEAQFAVGHLKEAIAAYQQAAATDPLNLDYKVALARIQIYAGQYEDALKTAGDAQLVDNNNAKSKAIYAWALDWNVAYGCRCQTLGAAESAAVSAIALDPNYAPAHAYYSEILNDGQKWSQGYQEADTALRLDPNSLDAQRAMGYANESVGDYEAAIESYKNALKINPNLITILLRVGLNYRALNPPDYKQAIFYFSKANAVDPKNIEPYLYLSRTHYQNDELGTAVQYLEQALQLEPGNPDIHGRLGLILFKRRNYEGAEPELRLAVLGGVVDGKGNPLRDAQGNPLKDANGQPVTSVDGQELRIDPLPLTGAITLEYYYTYGNLLAFLQKCDADQAPRFLNLALNFAPDDPTVVGSFDESMSLCTNGPASTDDTAAAAGTGSVAAITPTP